MKHPFTLIMFIMLPLFANAQEAPATKTEAGRFSVGGRSTLSAFSNDKQTGNGFGGQFRVQLGKHLNTEWFTDYISTNLNNLGYRRDFHIGWSVMFYPTANPLQKGKLTPYFLAGHCFDLTRVKTLLLPYYPTDIQDRFSSAVQMGLGTHYNFSDRVDISLSTQYMLHLGKDLHVDELTDNTGVSYLRIEKEDAGLEGHLLTTLSMNIRIADFIKKK